MATPVGAGCLGEADVASPASRGKAMTGRPGWRRLQLGVIRLAGSSAKRVERLALERSRPAVEDLHHLGAGLDLQDRYSIVASVSRSMSAPKVSPGPPAGACAGPWSGVPLPAIM
jgi:hypothetical protein